MIEKISFLSEIEVTDASVIIKEMNDYNSVIKKNYTIYWVSLFTGTSCTKKILN